jgi:hypothetical protein
VDALEGARVGAVLGDELGHEGEGLGGVDRLLRAVELLVAEAEGVEVAAICRLLLAPEKQKGGELLSFCNLPLSHRPS